MSLKSHQPVPYTYELVGCSGFGAGRFKIVYQTLVKKNVCCSNCPRRFPPKYLMCLGNFWKLVFWKLQQCSEAQLANMWHPQSVSEVVQDWDMHRNYKNLQENWFFSPRSWSGLGSVSPAVSCIHTCVCQPLCTCCQSTLSLNRCGSAANRSWWPVCWSGNLSFPVPPSGTSCLWWWVAASVNRSSGRDNSNIRWKIQ